MTDVAAPPRPRDLERHRVELGGYCYRMLGSSFEADDAVQETMMRAWKALDRFDGRSSLRTWLYRIATNVCLDMLAARRRRALPVELSPAASPHATLAAPLPETTWVEPVPTQRVLGAGGDPADAVVARESIRLAFVAALQHLPPRQRAVLILRDVLRWSASEAAELLDTTVASVNSALQRARATLDGFKESAGEASSASADHLDESSQQLLARYVDAFERWDVTAFVALLREDATHSMPPYEMWLRGPADIATWMRGPGAGCEGSKLVAVSANGTPAFAQYRRDPDGRGHVPFALHVIDTAGDAIAGIVYFLDTNLFELFGLPPRL